MRSWLWQTVVSMVVAAVLIIGAIAALPADDDSRFSERVRAMSTQVVRLDFGKSDAAKSGVAEAVVDAAVRSLTTIAATLLLVMGISFPLGILSATRPHSTIVRLVRRGVEGLSSLPVLVWSLVVLISASRLLRMTMDGSVHPAGAIFATALVLALGDHLLSDVTRRVENGTREILGEPYMRTVRAARLGEQRHVLQGLVTPIAGLIASRSVFLISAAIVAEYVFNSRGLGYWVVTVISQSPQDERSLLLASSLALTMIALAFRLAERAAVGLADRRTLS